MRFFLVLVFSLNFVTLVNAQELYEFPLRPVVNSNRVIGMGGAFVGVAEGADGHTYNPASFVSRFSYTRDDIWDWDWTFYSLNLPNAKHPDFSNKNSTFDQALHLGMGIDVKYTYFGLGVHIYGSEYTFSKNDKSRRYFQSNALLGAAFMIPIWQLSLGGTLNGGTNDISINDNDFARFEGLGANFGALWSPTHRPFRLGLNFQLAQFDEFVEEEGSIATPNIDGISQPSAITLGGSWMFWEKKYNPHMSLGQSWREKEATVLKRRYVLVALDLVTIFPSKSGVYSIGDLNEKVQRRSGQDINFALRLGLESEVVDDFLVLRSGYYSQPSRLREVSTFHHFTAGFDVHFKLGWDWKLNGVLDISNDYLNLGLGIGFWH